MNYNRYQDPRSKLRRPAMMDVFGSSPNSSNYSGGPTASGNQPSEAHEKPFYQELIEQEVTVRVYTTHPRVYSGKIEWSDRQSIMLVNDEGRRLIYKSAIDSVLVAADKPGEASNSEEDSNVQETKRAATRRRKTS